MEADKLRSHLSWQYIKAAANSGYSCSPENREHMPMVLKTKGDKKHFTAFVVLDDTD